MGRKKKSKKKQSHKFKNRKRCDSRNSQQFDRKTVDDINKKEKLVSDLTKDEFSKLMSDAYIAAIEKNETDKKKKEEGSRYELMARWYEIIGYKDYSHQEVCEFIWKSKNIWNHFVVVPWKACWVDPTILVEHLPEYNIRKDLPMFLLRVMGLFYYALSAAMFYGAKISYNNTNYLVMAIMLWAGLMFFMIARCGPRLTRLKLRMSEDDKFIEHFHAISINVVNGVLAIITTIVSTILIKWIFRS